MDEEELYRRVGSAIGRQRRRRGLQQKELALLVDLSRSSIANIEGGRQRFRVFTLVAIAHALRVTPSDLLGGL